MRSGHSPKIYDTFHDKGHSPGTLLALYGLDVRHQ